ncbi:MAG: S1 RNA-binding domain-containing protein [Candidatus Eremiobacteraeota bacterium]|nr:S1 RNA-binding domain-containing protein [Candidatus Eremiobacteraeota bacterium]MBV8354707.1 S1 RNA-binding domain-containing protein [Candidatus Eremiobacteraeota bacterium]
MGTTPAQTPAQSQEDQLALEQRLYEESLKVLDEGQVLTGVIVAKYQEELLVDIGGKSEGTLPFRELSLAIEPKTLKVGDQLEVMIHRIDDDGALFLSERRARALKTWEKVIDAHQRDEVIEATVTQVVKGGVLVDLGMRGFVPASQIRRQPVGNLDELVGKRLRLKVIDLDHKRHRVVLSQRQVLEEELNAKKQELLGTLEVGQIREGVVVRLAEFGAFVDLGGIDGLIHNSELSYARIKHPSEVVKVGDIVQVEVMKFDPEAKKVSLSLKHALPDPWVQHADQLVERNKLVAQIVKVTPNYLLVEIVPGVLAMVPKGEFDPSAQYSPGQEVEVTLLTINQSTRRITGSIQHVADVPPEEYEAYAIEEGAPLGTVGESVEEVEGLGDEVDFGGE